LRLKGYKQWNRCEFQWEDAFPTWSCDFYILSLHCEILCSHCSVIEDHNLFLPRLIINYRHFGGCKPICITNNCLPSDTASCLKQLSLRFFHWSRVLHYKPANSFLCVQRIPWNLNEWKK
jgi:hypothetical protein